MTNKIDLFKDKEYSEMEWLSKAIEPFIFPLNDTLAKMPNECQITYDFIVDKLVINQSHEITIKDAILFAAKGINDISPEDIESMKNSFKLDIEENTILNIETKTLTGEIKLLKIKEQYDDEDIKNIIGDSVNNIICNIHEKKADIGRLNEIMDLINHKDMRGSRSVRYKTYAIAQGYVDIIKQDKWRMRNAELIIKAAKWIKNYVENGNLADLSSFTRLKCMTHLNNGAPIYSMEETV